MPTAHDEQAVETTQHILVDADVAEAASKTSIQDALSHLQSQSNILSNQTALRAALASFAAQLSDESIFEIRSNWRGDNYFKLGTQYSAARANASRTGGISYLFEKIVEHLDEGEGNTLKTYQHRYVSRESERIFRLFASRALSLDASLEEALKSLKIESTSANRDLLRLQRADVRDLPEMPTSDPVEVGPQLIVVPLDHESETSEVASEQIGSDDSAPEHEGGYIEDSDTSD